MKMMHLVILGKFLWIQSFETLAVYVHSILYLGPLNFVVSFFVYLWFLVSFSLI